MGTIQKKGANVTGTLNFWVRGKGTSKVPVDYTANLTESTDDTLKRIAAQAITELTGGPPKGGIHIKAGDLQGQVFVDGQPLGALKSGDGTFTIPSGPHKITVKAPGYADAESQVVVKPTGAPTEVTLVPIQNEAKTPVNWRKVGGFASIGVGVGLGVVGLVSSLKVNSVAGDSQYEELRHAYPTSQDVCDSAKNDPKFTDIVGKCNSAKSAQTLQIVFYPLAAVAAGLGVYLVATSSPRRRSPPRPASSSTRRSASTAASSTSPTPGEDHRRQARGPASRGSEGLETRPTSDRVREALFSRLGYVLGARALDLYAGTGALGIEAISRGAKHAVFVESARPAVAALRANLEALGLTAETQVFAQAITRSLPHLAPLGPFDLVFLDPPYASLPEVPPIVAALLKAGALSATARVIVEHAKKDPAPPLPGLDAPDTRVYGTTSVSLYHRAEG